MLTVKGGRSRQKGELSGSGKSTKLSLSQSFCEYWANVEYADIPQSVVLLAKRHLLDTIAASIAGADAATTQSVRSCAEITHGRSGVCSLWGGDDAASPAAAALINGTAAHAWELDDFGGCGHSGACVAPAVWAAGEVARASGKQVILGVLAGYDLAARLLDAAGGYSPHNERGWHSTGTCGSYGAAAGAAKVLGLGEQEYCSALGCAGTFVGGTWGFLQDGAMTKRLHPGKAAETGLVAAVMAQQGVTGPQHVLDATWGGFLNTYCGPEASPIKFLEGLGTTFLIAGSGIKPYASCRGVHAALDAIFELKRQRTIRWQDIDRITLHLTEENHRFVGGTSIVSTLDAQMSAPYSVAVALVTDAAGLSEYHVQNAQALELMARIEVVSDLDIVQPGTYSAADRTTVELRMLDGAIYRNHVEIPRGGSEFPLSQEEIVEKAKTLISPVLGERQSDALLDFVMSLETCGDLSEAGKLITRHGSRH